MNSLKSMNDLANSLLQDEAEIDDANVISRILARAPKMRSEDENIPADLRKQFKDHATGRRAIFLQAVEDTIQSQGGQRRPASYYAVLLCLLTSAMDNDEEIEEQKEEMDLEGRVKVSQRQETETEIILQLLSMVIPFINISTLRKEFQTSGSLFLKLLRRKLQENHVLPLAIKVAGLLLAAQPLNRPLRLGIEVFQFLLALSLDHRSSVREISLFALRQAISEEAADQNEGDRERGKQVGDSIVHLFDRTIEENIKSGNLTLGSETLDEIQAIVRMLKTVDKLIDRLPASKSFVICERVLALLSQFRSHQTIARGCIEVLINLCLTGDVNEKILLSIIADTLSSRPDNHNYVSVKMFSQLLVAASIRACKNKIQDYQELFSRTATELLQLFPQITSVNCYEEIRDSLSVLLKECITNVFVEDAANKKLGPSSALMQTVNNIISSLQYPNQNAWPYLLAVIRQLVASIGIASGSSVKFANSISPVLPILEPILKDLERVIIQEPVGSANTLAAGKAIGAAIETVGCATVLHILPLNLHVLPGQPGDRRYLIPLLSKSVSHSSLQFFIQSLLPLLQTAGSAKQKDSDFKAKQYRWAVLQIWGLFPSFCKNPCDIEFAFPKIAKTLGTILKDDAEIRPFICRGLQNLKQSASAQDIAAMAKFSNNFIPLMFSLYENETNLETKADLLKAIQTYISISEPEVSNSYFAKVVRKLLEAKKNQTSKKNDKMMDIEEESQNYTKQRTVLTELADSFVPVLNEQNVQLLFRVIKSQLSDSQTNIQKQSYGILERICLHHPTFITEKKDQLVELLKSCLSQCISVSKKPRLHCWLIILKTIDKNEAEELSKQILSEVILALKEPNAKTRAFAKDIIILSGKLCNATENSEDVDMDTGERKHEVDPLMLRVSAGLGGGDLLLTATLEAISILLREPGFTIKFENRSKLLRGTLILLQSPSRPVIASVLPFIRACLSSADVKHGILDEIAKDLINLLVQLDDHHKMAVKSVLRKLLKIMGEINFQESFPPLHRKLATAICKEIRKKQRAKLNATNAGKRNTEESSDEESEQTEEQAGKQQSEKQKNPNKGVRINEKEDIIDLLDPLASYNLVKGGTKRPRDATATKKKAFEIDPETGKWIIEEPHQNEPKNVPENDEAEGMGLYVEAVKQKSELLSKKSHKGWGRGIEDEGESAGGQKPVSKKRKKDRKGDHVIAHSGKEFASKNAQGDVKKGKFEPYAYVPLDKSMINKRKKTKASREFQAIINSGKKGRKSGEKNKG